MSAHLMTWISLPYGGPDAGFNAVDLKNHMVENGLDCIIQGHTACTLAEHPKRHSLDYWLRDKHTTRRDTMQAVRDVIDQLEATGMFYSTQCTCPQSGRRCNALALRRV